MRKIYKLVIIFTIIIAIPSLIFAESQEEILIKNLSDGLSINYKSTIINIIENEPITIITDGTRLVYLNGSLFESNDIFETGDSATNSVLEYEVDILEGKIKDVYEDEIITDGRLLIDTNVGSLLLDEDGIYFEGKNRVYFIRNGGFDIKNKYKLKFTEIEKKKEESILKDENEELRNQIREIREMLKERNNNSNNYNISNNNQEIPKNILASKGNLTVTAIAPEDLKEDIFVELQSIDENNEIKTFYLSPNNGFANKQEISAGDYTISSVYFLNNNIKNDYEFNHNGLVKILEKQDIYLSIEAKPIKEVVKADNLLVKKDPVDEVLEVIANSNNEDMEETPKDKRPFFFLVLILGLGVVFLVFKYKDKILYKD